jgi:hypothetical protein
LSTTSAEEIILKTQAYMERLHSGPSANLTEKREEWSGSPRGNSVVLVTHKKSPLKAKYSYLKPKYCT